MDSELSGGAPVEGPHGKVIGAAIMAGGLLCEVIQGEEGMRVVKPFRVLAVAALDLAVLLL